MARDSSKASFKSTTGRVTAAVYFDTSYEQELPPSAGSVTLKLERLILMGKYKKATSRRFTVVIKCGRHWAQFPAGSSNSAAEVCGFIC